MGTACEYVVMLSVMSAVATVTTSYTLTRLDEARERFARNEARWVRAHPADAAKLETLKLPGDSNVRYGWGFVSVPPTSQAVREALLSDAPLPRPERRERPVTPGERQLLGGSFAAMLALGAGQARARHRRLRDAIGVDETVPEPSPPGGSRDPYRSAAPTRTRRRLSPSDTQDFTRRCAIGLGAWVLSTALIAFAANGVSTIPMPIVLMSWALLHLPGALLFLRFRAGVIWAPGLSLFGATLAAFTGSPIALLMPLALMAILTLTTFGEERHKRAEGRLP